VPTASLALATPGEIDEISRESYVLWGGGLSLQAYRELWQEVGRCRWALEHARYYVWRDASGRVLSSMKVYRPRMRIMGREGRCSVLGAIYTPRANRRRGHASEMVLASLEEMRERHDLAAMLFSDIGTRYYAKFGFLALPAREHTGRLPARPVHSGTDLEFRPARSTDLELFRTAHAISSAERPIAVLRDAEHWEFLWIRSRSFFSRVKDPAVKHAWNLALLDGQCIGYLITVEGRGEWNVREVGSLDGQPATMARILSHAGSRAYRAGLRRFYGWLPTEIPDRLECWSIHRSPRRRAVPMLRVSECSIDPGELTHSEAIHIPFQDQF
jgi:hypothetical protein